MKELIGKIIVGYRYGEAPPNERSMNYASNTRECGVSMAQVGYLPEYRSFAILEAKESRKRFYYIGEIAGEGGDSELCLTNLKRISYTEYLKAKKETKDVSNEYVNFLMQREIRLANMGYNGYDEDKAKKKYQKYIK